VEFQNFLKASTKFSEKSGSCHLWVNVAGITQSFLPKLPIGLYISLLSVVQPPRVHTTFVHNLAAQLLLYVGGNEKYWLLVELTLALD
jgi:hypothetical protein